jgi:hypothetical protein
MAPGDTCENEQLIMAAVRREVPERVPSFVQSIMPRLIKDYLARYEDEIKDEVVLLTPIGDFTVYKGFGFSSHWIEGQVNAKKSYPPKRVARFHRPIATTIVSSRDQGRSEVILHCR